MMEPRPRSLVQNLNTFHDITPPPPPPLDLLSIEEGDPNPNHEKLIRNKKSKAIHFLVSIFHVFRSGLWFGELVAVFGLGRVMAMDMDYYWNWTHVYGVLGINSRNHNNCSNMGNFIRIRIWKENELMKFQRVKQGGRECAFLL